MTEKFVNKPYGFVTSPAVWASHAKAELVKALPYGLKVETRVVEDLPIKSFLHGTEKDSTSELNA